ncbi:MAG: hypothetical protein AAB268_08060 [Elusimicrobiota bacterium]
MKELLQAVPCKKFTAWSMTAALLISAPGFSRCQATAAIGVQRMTPIPTWGQQFSSVAGSFASPFSDPDWELTSAFQTGLLVAEAQKAPALFVPANPDSPDLISPQQIQDKLRSLKPSARIRYLDGIKDAKETNRAILRFTAENIKDITLKDLESLAKAVKKLDLRPFLPPIEDVRNDPNIIFSQEVDDLFAQDHAYGDDSTKMAMYKTFYDASIQTASQACEWMASAQRVGIEQTAGYHLRNVLQQRLKSGEPTENVEPYLEAFSKAPQWQAENVREVLEELVEARAKLANERYAIGILSPEEIVRLAKYIGPSYLGRSGFVNLSLPFFLDAYERRHGELTPARIMAFLEVMQEDSGHAETAWRMILKYYDLRAQDVSVDQALAWSDMIDSSVFHDSSLKKYIEKRPDLSDADLKRIKAAYKQN